MTQLNTDPRASEDSGTSRGYFANIRINGHRTALATIGMALLAAIAVALACTVSTPTPTAAPTPTPAPTATPDPSPTATTEPSSTPVPTATATATASPTATATATPSSTATPTPIPTPTATPAPIPTRAPTPVPTQTPTPVPTATPVPTQTPTPAPTATPTPSPTATPIPLPSIEDQRSALAAFYAATDGDNWNDSYGWLTDLPLDQWFGVATDEQGNVIELSLVENNLSGPIPDEILQLGALESLYLWDNQLTGSIPPEIGQLTALGALELGSNKLTGTIPPELGNLRLLQSLSLADNELTGEIPAEIGNLTALAGLDLQSNNLSGTIPPEIGNLKQLEFLLLASNELTGMIPEPLGRLTELQWVLVSGNRFEGCFPETLRLVENNDSHELDLTDCVANPVNPDDRAVLVELYNATGGDNWTNNEGWLSDLPLGAWHGVTTDPQGNVVALWLRENNLSGTIPSEIGNLKLMSSLHLSLNELTGDIPSQIWQLTELTILDLQSNKLTGTVPPEIGNLKLLGFLYLAGNELTGEIPPELGGLTALHTLVLQANKLTGEIPPGIGNLKLLNTLDLSSNDLTGAIPPELGGLTELEFMFVSLNRFTDCSIPEPLRRVEFNDFNAPNITNCGSGISDPANDRAVLVKLYNATNGDEWDINDNWLSDKPLATWHGVVVDRRGSVAELDLFANNLSGTLIPDIGELTALTSLDLGANYLTGMIPSEIGALSVLTSLHLGGNRLTGAIPTEIGNLRLLGFLSLAGNNLTGTIPPEIGQITWLRSLHLRENNLSGGIPAELGNLTELEWVLVYPNKFEDCTIPGPLQLVRTNDFDELTTRYCTPDPNDRAVLAKLYNATNGDEWHNNENWLSDQPLAAWHGVDVNNRGKVTEINLEANNLRGTLIHEIAQLPELKSLWLDDNHLTGTIPVELTSLNKLISISLANNEISGRIPAEIGLMTGLQLLMLSGNNLSGPIPSSLGNLAELFSLSLASNELTGGFPAWVRDLRWLFRLTLNDNQLTVNVATLPEHLQNLEDLERFSIAGNNLSGCLPAALHDIKETDFLFSSLNFCDEPSKQTPTSPSFIKWEVGGAARSTEERAARFGVQWLFEYAESIGWPIVGDDITVHFKTLEPLVNAAAVEDGSIGEGEIESLRDLLSARFGFARGDSNFNRAANPGVFLGEDWYYATAATLAHENIHTAFQYDINGLYTNPASVQRQGGLGPTWFVEGMATYFGELITSLHTGETDFLCRDCEIGEVPVSDIALTAAEDSIYCAYQCGAFAIELLASIVGQRHIVDFYTMRRPGQTWQQAFEEAFGISVPDFYALYDQHRAAGFPKLNPPIVPETGR